MPITETHRLKVMLLTCLIISISLLVGCEFFRPKSDGFCKSNLRFTSDAEFIRYSLMGYTRILKIAATEDAIDNFLTKYPDCCTVYRDRTEEIEMISRSIWWDGVVVRLRSEASTQSVRRGEPPVGNDVLVVVNNCLTGTEQLTEYMTGG